MDPGTKVLMWKKKDNDNDNQLFYEDKYGYIHSKLNGFVFDSAGKMVESLMEIQTTTDLYQHQFQRAAFGCSHTTLRWTVANG